MLLRTWSGARAEVGKKTMHAREGLCRPENAQSWERTDSVTLSAPDPKVLRNFCNTQYLYGATSIPPAARPFLSSPFHLSHIAGRPSHILASPGTRGAGTPIRTTPARYTARCPPPGSSGLRSVRSVALSAVVMAVIYELSDSPALDTVPLPPPLRTACSTHPSSIAGGRFAAECALRSPAAPPSLAPSPPCLLLRPRPFLNSASQTFKLT